MGFVIIPTVDVSQMSSLADLPELVGFFSYSREDDDSFKGMLSALRDAIQRELSAQLGRSKKTFRLWQDQESIAPGQFWASEIKNAVEQAVFFIPIITPRMVNSHNCHFEFEAFVARERALGRSDLVFPILYISVPALENEAQWRGHPVLSFVGQRQWVDWRPFRHQEVQTTAVREAIERFCSKIVEALHGHWVSPEDRQRQEEAEARERADVQRRQEEAEAKRSAEEEARLKRAAEEERVKRAQEEDRAKRNEAVEAHRVAEERQRQEESEAERRATEDEHRKKEDAEAQRIVDVRHTTSALDAGLQQGAPAAAGFLMTWRRRALWIGGLFLVAPVLLIFLRELSRFDVPDAYKFAALAMDPIGAIVLGVGVFADLKRRSARNAVILGTMALGAFPVIAVPTFFTFVPKDQAGPYPFSLGWTVIMLGACGLALMGASVATLVIRMLRSLRARRVRSGV
jgi:hypothetical protein